MLILKYHFASDDDPKDRRGPDKAPMGGAAEGGDWPGAKREPFGFEDPN